MLMEDLLGGVSFESIPKEHQANLEKLLAALCSMESEVQASFTCASGYRTLAHHEEIYRLKNEKRIQAGLTPVSVPMGSNHLLGFAADLADSKRALQHWVLDHLEYAEDHGLYFEAFDACQFPSAWLHIQIVPPKSGKRFFEP